MSPTSFTDRGIKIQGNHVICPSPQAELRAYPLVSVEYWTAPPTHSLFQQCKNNVSLLKEKYMRAELCVASGLSCLA